MREGDRDQREREREIDRYIYHTFLLLILFEDRDISIYILELSCYELQAESPPEVYKDSSKAVRMAK